MKFYGTLGPSCHEEKTLEALFEAGMTGIRLNLSHGALPAREPWLRAFHKAAERTVGQADLLIDLQGPELRAGNPEPAALPEGGVIRLGEGGIPVPAILLAALTPGLELLLDDGAFLLRVDSCAAGRADCLVERGGVLFPSKSIAVPGAALHPPTLTEADQANLALAAGYGVTGVMLPFVRDGADLACLRLALEEAGASNVRVFAKLENRAGVGRLSELLPLSDEIVIARGDLGNDMPLWELPAIQKSVAAQCRAAGKPFLVVTQLLHSMQHSAVPTRAEVSDIYNAVLDGAASLMLTGETAVGEYPVEAMTYLCRTAREAEKEG